ncbi:MAG: hypothetical protein V3V92_05385, partial [Candidatus Hydrothermarchaeales archaeon]
MKMKYVLSLLALILLFVVPSTASAQNSCTECHSEQNDPWLWPVYQEWARSPHSEEGVTCDLCHGGDPTSSNIEDAHIGVLGPEEPESKIHYTNIIPMCGDGSDCHSAISEAYPESKHYENLMEGNLAPDCRTCMGSHDVTLDKEHIILGCQKCMNSENNVGEEPLLKGISTHAMMEATQSEIHEAEKLLKLSQEKGLNLTIAQAELQDAKTEMVGHEVDFHTFQTDGQLETLSKS